MVWRPQIISLKLSGNISLKQLAYCLFSFSMGTISALLWRRLLRIVRSPVDDEDLSWLRRLEKDSCQPNLSDPVDLDQYFSSKSRQTDKNIGSDEETFHPAEEFSREGFRVVHVKVPRRAVAAIIGKNGDVIRHIQSSTKTTIKFLDKSRDPGSCLEPQTSRDVFSAAADDCCEAGAPENGESRTCASAPPQDAGSEEIVVRGQAHNVEAALKRIQAIVDSVPVMQTKTVLVDSRFVGRIIGVRGEAIRRLRQESGGAVIDVQRKLPGGSSSQLTQILLRGTEAQISAANLGILKILQSVERESRYRPNTIDQSRQTDSATTRNHKLPHEPSRTPINGHVHSCEVSPQSVDQSGRSSPLRPATPSISLSGGFTRDTTSQLVTGSLDSSEEESCGTTTTSRLSHVWTELDQHLHHTLPQLQFPRGESGPVRVVVTVLVDCQNFSVHLADGGHREALAQLGVHMTDHYRHCPEAQQVMQRVCEACSLRPGHLVVALFPADQTWQRAVVFKIQPVEPRVWELDTTTVDVDYCDYGDHGQLLLKNVRLIRGDDPVEQGFLRLPRQAIFLRLHGIDKPNRSHSWSEDAVDYFEEICGSREQRILTAFLQESVCEQTSVPTIPSVSLSWPDAKPPIRRDLAAELVRRGHAKWLR